MEDRLSKYLKSIVDYKYEKFEDYDLFKFEATFDEIKKEIKLYRGNESFKITTAFECPICNNDVFIAINSFNNASESFKAYHNGSDVIIECNSYYSDILMNVIEVLDELMTDDYEYIVELIKVIDKNNKIDKAELLENVISILNEGKNE